MCHRHWVAAARPLVLAFLLNVAAVALALTAPEPAATRVLLGLGVAFAGGLWAMAGWIRWDSFRIRLTDRRLILADGLVARTTKIIWLDRIQDIATRQGVAGRFLGYGSLGIETAGSDPAQVVDHLPAVDAFRDLVFTQARGPVRAPLP